MHSRRYPLHRKVNRSPIVCSFLTARSLHSRHPCQLVVNPCACSIISRPCKNGASHSIDCFKGCTSRLLPFVAAHRHLHHRDTPCCSPSFATAPHHAVAGPPLSSVYLCATRHLYFLFTQLQLLKTGAQDFSCRNAHSSRTVVAAQRRTASVPV